MPDMGAITTWILGWLLSLVQEAILVVIPMGGHLGYYPSTGGHVGCYPYERPYFLFHY